MGQAQQKQPLGLVYNLRLTTKAEVVGLACMGFNAPAFGDGAIGVDD